MKVSDIQDDNLWKAFTSIYFLDGSLVFIMLSANRCPPVPDVDNAQSNTEIANVGTQVEYNCHEGHLFPDHSVSKVATCKANLVWEGIHSADRCERLYILHNLLYTSLSGHALSEYSLYKYSKGVLCQSGQAWHKTYFKGTFCLSASDED